LTWNDPISKRGFRALARRINLGKQRILSRNPGFVGINVIPAINVVTVINVILIPCSMGSARTDLMGGGVEEGLEFGGRPKILIFINL
jgi:hypothetical protein